MIYNTLVIHQKLPGLNNMCGKRGYSLHKKEYTNMCIQALIRQRCVPREPHKCICVSYEFHEKRGDERDPDNAMGGIKYIHDALESAGVVVNDDMYHISIGAIKMVPDDKHYVVVKWEVM